jgi:hypothetical protein
MSENTCRLVEAATSLATALGHNDPERRAYFIENAIVQAFVGLWHIHNPTALRLLKRLDTIANG